MPTLPDLEPVFHLLPDEDSACAAWTEARWTPPCTCPGCGADALRPTGKDPTRRRCAACKRVFSATARTPLARTRTPKRAWAVATFAVAASTGPPPASALARAIGVTPAT